MILDKSINNSILKSVILSIRIVYIPSSNLEKIYKANKNLSELQSFSRIKNNQKLSACFTFNGLSKTKVEKLEAGDIIAISGIEGVEIGDTISDNDNPEPLPRIEIDSPTVSMFFQVNNSPFAGKEGKYLTRTGTTTDVKKGLSLLDVHEKELNEKNNHHRR